MEDRTLEILKFHISNKDEKKTKLPLNSLDGVDLIDNLFENFVSFIDDFPTDEKNKRIIQFGKDEDSKTIFSKKESIRSITGIIETGKFGKEERVVDITKKKDDEPVFTIHINHSVQKPFFFMICIPEIKKDGIIILEREGQFGINSIFTAVLRKFIELNFEGTSIYFENFIDDQIINNYINKGGYNSIKLVRNSLPEDVAERYGLETFQTDDFIVELTIRTKGKRLISGNARERIKKLFESNPDGFFTSEEFAKIGFDEHATIKVNSTYKKSTRTINLSDTMKFRPYYDITVDINASGHSDFKSITIEAIGLLKDLKLDLF